MTPNYQIYRSKVKLAEVVNYMSDTNKFSFELWLRQNKDIHLPTLIQEYKEENHLHNTSIIDSMIEFVGDCFNIKKKTILKKTRKREVVFARYVIASLIYQYFDKRITLERISRILGYTDHSVIIHGLHKVADLYSYEKSTIKVVDDIFSHYGLKYKPYMSYMC